MDLEAEVRIPFLVAARGGTQSLTIKRDVPCPRCQGTGAEPGSPTAECPACRGGRQPSEAPCATCGGRGHLPRILCRHCQGTGGVAHERTITVRVPAAIESGTRLRIGGEGETGVGGTPNGDLYVTVLVDPHPRWGREGADVHDELALDLGQVILGATVKVNTVNGDVALRIPPGTQPETTFRLTGHGMPRGGESDGRGDHLVRVHVAIPQGLSDEARRMFEEFARSIGLNAERS